MGFILNQSNITIQRIINEAMIRKLSVKFSDNSKINLIEDIVRKLVERAIKSTDVWKNLLNEVPKGLTAHFGIPKGTIGGRLDSILATWLSEIKVEAQPVRRQSSIFVFAYKFYAIQADFANVLNLEAGVTLNISKNHPEGQRLPWLEWLLVSGDEVEIQDYHILLEPGHKGSRSGNAIMVPRFSWKVPKISSHAYNSDNNFITEALEKLANDSDFRETLLEEFRKISSLKNISSLFTSFESGDL